MPSALTPTAPFLVQYSGLPPHTNEAGCKAPDVTFKDPKNRRVRVTTIGAGYSGILLAYKLKRELQSVEHA
jgi:hypothetical protein